MIQAPRLDDFVVCILAGEHHFDTAATLKSIERWQMSEMITVDLVVNHNSQLDYFTFLEQAKARHPGKHLIAMHADIYFAEDFLHRLVEQVALIEEAGVAWGLLGPAGVTYPYFKIVRNMVDYHGILYPFARPLPATHLDGHLLVIHKDLKFDFSPDYRGFHHYDTMLCIRSWEQGLPVFVINLPLYHLGQGNVDEWKVKSEVLGKMLGKVYGNKTLMTSMGPVSLNVEAGVTRDFYKHAIEPALADCFRGRLPADVVFVVRVDREDESAVRETLLSICGQFEKPVSVIVLCPEHLRVPFDATFRYFSNFVELKIMSSGPERGLGADDVLMGCGAQISAALPERASVAFLNCGTILYPNYVQDIRRFHIYGINAEGVVPVLDFNYALRETEQDNVDSRLEEHLVESWKTETIDDLVAGGIIPLASFAAPADVARSIIDDHIYGTLTEQIFAFKIAARAQVFFLRRLGGFLHKTAADLSSKEDPMADIAVRSEFLRSSYPFSYIWMRQRSSSLSVKPQSSRPKVQVQMPATNALTVTREQLLARKLCQYPKVVDGIFRLNRVIKRLRRSSVH